MRPTLEAEIPTSAAVVRVLRRRMPGASWPALASTSSITAGEMDALAPRPGRSVRPSSPSRSKRCDHLLTDVVDNPTARATSVCQFIDDVRVMGNVLHRLRVPRRVAKAAQLVEAGETVEGYDRLTEAVQWVTDYRERARGRA